MFTKQTEASRALTRAQKIQQLKQEIASGQYIACQTHNPGFLWQCLRIAGKLTASVIGRQSPAEQKETQS